MHILSVGAKLKNGVAVVAPLEKSVAPVADGIEVGHFICHSLRHTFATKAIENGFLRMSLFLCQTIVYNSFGIFIDCRTFAVK